MLIGAAVLVATTESAVEIDSDGRSIWVAERCGANTCLDGATGQMSSSPSIYVADSESESVTLYGAEVGPRALKKYVRN